MMDWNNRELRSEFAIQIADLLDKLAACGADERGGVTRLLYSEAWQEAWQLLKNTFEEWGIQSSADAVGNLFGILEGTNKELPSILTGSHLDTVVQGGKYDGAYGIAASMVALRYLQRTFGKPIRTIEAAAFCEEEGSRFPVVYWGSGNIAGERSLKQAAAIYDKDGLSLLEAMRQCGFGFGENLEKPCVRRDVSAYLEAHIEQGPILEHTKCSIGVVQAIVGQRRWKFEVIGESNHAGTTPMSMRRDALEGANAMMTLLREEAARRDPELTVTIGQLAMEPNSANSVPGKVAFTVDTRHRDRALLDDYSEWLLKSLQAVAADRQLAVTSVEWLREEPVPMDPGFVKQFEEICAQAGLLSRTMVSGAGHDAQMLHSICPTGMIFVPSRGGISHSPLEHSEPEHMADGALVLAEMLYRLAYKEDCNV